MSQEEPNIAKLAEMTHYIINKCQNKPRFGSTVLHKLLYFSDFNYYKLNFEAISNEKYRKFENGPAPSHFPIILAKLKEENKIEYFESKIALEPNTFKSLKEPENKFLNAKEIEIIDKVISKLSNLNANEISKLSHEDNPYKSTKMNEVISYGLVFYRTEEIEKKVE